MRQHGLHTATGLFLGLLSIVSISAYGQPALPSLGDRISGTVSLDEEYDMGQRFLSQIRRSTPAIPDALLNSYLETLTYKLASRSQLKDHRLSFVIIDSEQLNAFAAPGGIIGVNTGLFLNAQSEAEFASVMAHEIAHVSQRHFARSVDEAQAGRIPQMGALLASVLIMATSDGGHGVAAVTAAQGLSVDNQLRFSRSNEAEADRVGQDTMYRAGFDPDGMSSLFERLAAINRFGRRPPEFLLTHPVTESRISDARARAYRYPGKDYYANLEYQVMRARVVAHYAVNKSALVNEYRQLLEDSSSPFTLDVNRYALAVAYYENEQYNLASQTLTPLLDKDPNRISYAVTQAEILTAQNEPGQSLNFLQRHLEINPDNHPLTMAAVDALTEARSYGEAAQLMERHIQQRPNDDQLWFRLSETQGQAGNISEVHKARAEYFRLLGDYLSSRQQLQFALRIETENGAAPAEAARLRQRIREVEELAREQRG
ncbi:MAG: M48 family metallopeptidase [Gammaproteobacteria bacterium]|jgi:predicted Zn-dependent protease|nr:M48 family metallopeptidase [Gammaproteobacteria bacterium]MBT3860400.1 M48 family metallopeptidase [Gammaproteobacteria bacterium]MBT3986015.1 M48 family metallopeptidase [Gammaproteobacteria bacterium]MBT4257548.1 M48 family metallopeptidase [Gammaproteobacteria bacterium]MBT4582377.1 M48 family metallopeptidase [Gammaproteobacteria bacterium]